ncbi:unnamed protein product [Cylindrotheca closterium]|uniref:Uncharacterized protein n=1 Tax=Cylindrotheca closterium TaxID=2856 RepID=A0AAD2CM95_9STRA|nr:unnamed protein product [Cylindrotheca closterium]
MQHDENATRDDNESGDSNTQWNYGRSNNGSHGGQFIQQGHTDNHPRQQGMMLFQHNNTGIHLDSGSTFHLRTNEGILKDFHKWTDGRGFIFDEVPAGMELDEIHIGPNNLNDDMEGYCALQSVEKNKEGFTNKQVKRTNIAQSGYHMMGAPGAELFKLAIWGNFFKNCPITEEDVNISEKIYGPSVSTIKGKQKRPTPKAVVGDWIEMPKELLKHNSYLNLCIDVMFINNVAFLSVLTKQSNSDSVLD